jgi:hypothetical protein
MVGILTSLNTGNNGFMHYLNTNTLMDLTTGAFAPGVDGNSILNGGLAFTNAVGARPQTYKSTVIESYAIAVMEIFPDAQALVNDTEHSLLQERIINFNDSVLLPKSNTLSDRFTLIDKTNPESYAEPFLEKIKAICQDKEAHKKDFMVESPFMDPKTMKPYMMWIPTLVGFDSWSEMSSNAVYEMYEKNDVGSSGVNMVYMKDGGIKTKIMSMLPSLAAKYGIYFIFTAHMGDKYNLDGFGPVSKELQYMKQGDKLKKVGADFNFLVSNLFELRGASLLQTKDKECLYPDNYSTATELSSVNEVLCRCKNNGSGSQIQLIVSQQTGVQSDLTNYHYLKENKYAGLSGNERTHSPVLLPNDSLQRTKVRDKLREYKTARAIQLLAQYYYIQNNWVLRNSPIDFSNSIEKFAEKLIANKTYAIDAILESRGYYTYDKKNTRQYMSIFDAVQLANTIK